MSIQSHAVRVMSVVAVLVALSPCVDASENALDPEAQALIHRIDERLAARWTAAGVRPNPPASDAEFLRRASLDLTGVIPSVSDVRAYLSDASPDKRAVLIEQFLKKPTLATRLTNHWRDALLPPNTQMFFGQTITFEQWLRGKFADNVPYDTLVRELLTATGNVGQPGPAIYYTALELKPEQLAASTSRMFLGVQISCAECHKHPFDHWTQDDFWGYAAFFAQLQRSQQQQQNAFGANIVDATQGEVKLPGTETVVAPRFLGSDQDTTLSGQSRREKLAAWLTSKENPYFAKAAVNRVWALLFGYGLVNPIDDFGAHNPPLDDVLLAEIASDFAKHNFDVRRLLRILANTQAYTLSSEVVSESPDDPLLFHRMPIKSLNAEQIWDCVAEATCRRESANDEQMMRRGVMYNPNKQAFLAKFEAPTQAATEFQSGIPQALSMMNGEVINNATNLGQSDILSAIIEGPFFTNADRLEILFMAALTRKPTDAEREKFLAYVETGSPGGNSQQALADVLWALLNSTEFILNH